MDQYFTAPRPARVWSQAATKGLCQDGPGQRGEQGSGHAHKLHRGPRFQAATCTEHCSPCRVCLPFPKRQRYRHQGHHRRPGLHRRQTLPSYQTAAYTGGSPAPSRPQGDAPGESRRGARRSRGAGMCPHVPTSARGESGKQRQAASQPPGGVLRRFCR